MSTITDRLAAVRARIRSPSVTLIAVSKRQSVDAIREAYAAGQRAFGENYAQELATKREQLADLPDIEWHFVGALQSNKAKLLVPGTALIHAVDRLSAAEALSRRRGDASILIEVNIGGEESKSGVAPDQVGAMLREIRPLPSLTVRGLMCIPPHHANPADARPFFQRMRNLRDELAGEFPSLVSLSMGMSGDFEIAIEEGATHVRVGTAIFGERPKS